MNTDSPSFVAAHLSVLVPTPGRIKRPAGSFEAVLVAKEGMRKQFGPAHAIEVVAKALMLDVALLETVPFTTADTDEALWNKPTATKAPPRNIEIL